MPRPRLELRPDALRHRVLALAAVLAACAGDEGREVALRAEGRPVEGGFPVTLRALAWSSDGGALLGGDAAGRVHHFDDGGARVETRWTGHHGAVTAVALRPDGTLVTFGADGAFRLAAPDRPGRAGRPLVPAAPTETALINRDGTAALLWEGGARRAGGCEPRAAALWLWPLDGSAARRLSTEALCAAFSADGRRGVVVEARGARIFTAAGRFTARLDEPGLAEGARVQGVAVSDDGRRVAAVVRGELLIVEPGRPAVRYGRRVLVEHALPVAFTPGGDAVVALLPDPVEPGRLNLDLYDAGTGALQRRLMAHVPPGAGPLAVAPSGDAAALVLPAGEARRFDLRAPEAEAVPLRARHWLGAGLAVSADGRRTAACHRNEVEIRSLGDGALHGRFTVDGLSCAVDYPLALDAAGERIALGAPPEAPFVARDARGAVVATYARPPGSAAHRPAFSRDGRWLAALIAHGPRAYVFVWPADGGDPVWDALLPPLHGVSGLAVSTDGALVVASYAHVRDDGRVIGEVGALTREEAGLIWSRSHGTLAEPGLVALTPDDRRAVFSSIADELLVLDARSGELVVRGVNSADTVWTFARFGTVGVYAVLPALEEPAPRPPRRPVSALAVDPEGHRAVVAGYNRSNRLPLLEVFDLRSGRLLTARGMASYPPALVVRRDAVLAPGLATAGGDLTVLRIVGEGD